MIERFVEYQFGSHQIDWACLGGVLTICFMGWLWWVLASLRMRYDIIWRLGELPGEKQAFRSDGELLGRVNGWSDQTWDAEVLFHGEHAVVAVCFPSEDQATEILEHELLARGYLR